MSDPRTALLQKRLKIWRIRLVAAQERGDDAAYVAACRVEIEKLEDALGSAALTNTDKQ